MRHNIYIKDGALHIEVLMKSQRSNPWDEDFHDDMDNIVGVIAGDEVGFAEWIDMDYKDKPDQVSDMFYSSWMGKSEFRELCKTLGVDVVEHPVCVKCRKVIYGTHGWDGGPLCSEHEGE